MTWNDWNPYRGIPLWLIIAVGIACIFFVIFYEVYIVKRHNSEKKYRYRKWWISVTVFYIFTILCATCFGREISIPKAQWRIFWTLVAALRTGEWKYWYFIIGNILLFAPLGFLLCQLFGRSRCQIRIVLLCLLFSCIIEAIQYITGTGLCEFDDIFHNTLGGGLGGILGQIGNLSES